MNTNKTNKKKDFKKNLDNVPEHIKNLVLILKNNSEIRRYTALGMINKLKAAGEIRKDAKVYINFYFSKFSISINGLKQEFYYNHSLFLNCLCASFAAFANNANKVITKFCEIENSDVDQKEINDIAENIKDKENSPVEE